MQRMGYRGGQSGAAGMIPGGPLGKGDFAQARREVDKAIELEPRSPTAHLMRSIIALSDKDPEGAIQSADTAIRFGKQLAPGSLAQADFIKANALIEVKRYDEA